MKRIPYLAGRALQIAALIALPSAIWIGQLAHDEKGAIRVFIGSVIVFFAGHLLTRVGTKL